MGCFVTNLYRLIGTYYHFGTLSFYLLINLFANKWFYKYKNGSAIVFQDRGSRTSVSESNVLLDPEVLPDLSIQALVLTVLATLVKYSTDEAETRVLYQYLAEGSVVFPKVFPVMWVWNYSSEKLIRQFILCTFRISSHSLLDQKINNILSVSSDQVVLMAVQSIIQNMLASEDPTQQTLHFMQSCGFGGLWRFAGPFTKVCPVSWRCLTSIFNYWFN